MSDMPPGRGYVVRRNKRYLVQVAHLDSKTMLPWLARLRQSRPSPTPPPPLPEPEQSLLEEARKLTDAALAGSL